MAAQVSTPQHYLNYKAKPGNQEKLASRWLCSEAIRKGELTRQPCEVCTADKTEAHHDDYSQPLDVRWLCHVCHAGEHAGASKARPVRRYCINGHHLTDANIYWSRNTRVCRECHLRRQRRYYQQRKYQSI